MLFESKRRYLHDLGAYEYWLVACGFLYAFCQAAFYGSFYANVGSEFSRDETLNVLMTCNALKPALLLIVYAFIVFSWFHRFEMTCLIVACTTFYFISFATAVKFVIDRFSSCNSPYHADNVCNDPLYCCVYYDVVPRCVGFGPCVGSNVTIPEDLKPNSDMVQAGSYLALFLFLEMTFIFVGFVTLLEPKRKIKNVAIVNRVLENYYKNGEVFQSSISDDDAVITTDNKTSEEEEEKEEEDEDEEEEEKEAEKQLQFSQAEMKDEETESSKEIDVIDKKKSILQQSPNSFSVSSSIYAARPTDVRSLPVNNVRRILLSSNKGRKRGSKRPHVPLSINMRLVSTEDTCIDIDGSSKKLKDLPPKISSSSSWECGKTICVGTTVNMTFKASSIPKTIWYNITGVSKQIWEGIRSLRDHLSDRIIDHCHRELYFKESEIENYVKAVKMKEKKPNRV
jgi:hypothetical protein